MALFSERSWPDWIEAYELSHQHAVNRVCHYIGIPLIILSLIMVPFSLLGILAWTPPIAFFILGWLFQFIGHYFEKKPPEFLKDWRFLFVGARWWLGATMAKCKKTKR